MKKIIKISSLGLVALLASCGSKNAALQKITPDAANIVAQALTAEREYEKEKFFLKHEDQKVNPLYDENYLPVSAKTFSADIEIKYNTDSENPIEGYVTSLTTVNKHIFFDMEKGFVHIHSKASIESNQPTKIGYPEVDYYAFFIEDEKQEEGATEFTKTGTYYLLGNYNNVYKVMLLAPGVGTKADYLNHIKESIFSDDIPIFDTKGSDNPFDLDRAINGGLISVTTNWTLMNQVYDSLYSDKLPTTGEVLLMQNYLTNSIGILISRLEYFRNEITNLKEENSYFDYNFRSNDAKSLGLETDLCKAIIDEPYIPSGIDLGLVKNGTVSQSSSFTIRDLYLTDSHFVISDNIKILDKETREEFMRETLNVSCDQTIKYNTSEKDEIPADYLDYIPAE